MASSGIYLRIWGKEILWWGSSVDGLKIPVILTSEGETSVIRLALLLKIVLKSK
jgi:hypothetical protein